MEDPSVLWKTMKGIYERASRAPVEAYITQLEGTWMKPNEKLMEYIKRLHIFQNKLVGVGRVTNSDEKQRSLLRGIREECFIPFQVIRSTEASYEKAIADLIIVEAEDNTKADNGMHDGTTQALNVKVLSGCTICGILIPRGVALQYTEQYFYNSAATLTSPISPISVIIETESMKIILGRITTTGNKRGNHGTRKAGSVQQVYCHTLISYL